MNNEVSTKPRKRKLIKRLKSKYRLLVANDITFEEKFSLRLTPLNLIVAGTALFFLLGAFYVSLIVYTPLKEYIPGYANTSGKSALVKTALRADSLEKAMEDLKQYQDNLSLILTGNIGKTSDAESNEQSKKQTDEIVFTRSEEDSLLRQKIEEAEQYSLSAEANSNRKLPSDVHFFPPLRGLITAKFDPSINHFGVDVVAPENESVKAALDGTVIAATWTSDGGYIIQLQHTNNLISIYKHNSILFKNLGDKVSAGDPIAVVGNTGEFTTGPHLHFELWRNGQAINPEKIIVFN